MNKKKALINAQESGAPVKVVYKAGRQPNHAREIIPIEITNNQVFAQCLNSSAKKLFYISKLKLLTDQQYDNLAKWDPDFIPPTDYEVYEIQRKRQNKLLRYFFGGFIIMVILVVCFTIMSKTS